VLQSTPQHFWREWLEGLLQLIFPPLCLVCNGVMVQSSGIRQICQNCLNNIESVPENLIKTHIFDRLEEAFLTDIFVAAVFNPVIQKIIHHIKYRKMNILAVQVAKYLQPFLPKRFFDLPIDLAVPVPLHPMREKERGYNQSLYIARGFMCHSPEIIVTHTLIRGRNTPSQTQLNREQRQINVKDAFQINSENSVKGKVILLVDDVVTTGATLNECARILKTAGAKEVYAATLSTPLHQEAFV